MQEPRVYRIYENSDFNSVIRNIIIVLWEQAYKVKNCLMQCIPDITENKAQRVAIHKVIEDFEIHTKDSVDKAKKEEFKEPYKMLIAEFFDCGLNKDEVIEVLMGTFKES